MIPLVNNSNNNNINDNNTSENDDGRRSGCVLNGMNNSNNNNSNNTNYNNNNSNEGQNNIKTWLQMVLENVRGANESLSIIALGINKDGREQVFSCQVLRHTHQHFCSSRRRNNNDNSNNSYYNNNMDMVSIIEITMEEYLHQREMSDVILMLFCFSYIAMIKALQIGKKIVIIQRKEEIENVPTTALYHRPFHLDISEMLDWMQCTYSVGVIKGTINVRGICEHFLAFLMQCCNSGESESESDGDGDDDARRSSLSSSADSEISNFLDFGGSGGGQFWEMPQNTEVFCVIPNTNNQSP